MCNSAKPSLKEVEFMNRMAMNHAVETLFDQMEAKVGDPIDQIASFLQQVPCGRMLDVGCGWARFIDYFIDHGLDYVGIDISTKMLEKARERHPDAAFLEMSHRKLAFPSNTFAGLWSCCSIEYEPKHNTRNVLQEMRRVLVDGGILGLLLPSPGVSDEGCYIFRDGKHRSHVSSWLVCEMREELERAGFTVIREEDNWCQGAMFFLAQK